MRRKSGTTDVGAQSCGDVELAAQANPMRTDVPAADESRASAQTAPTPSAQEFRQLQDLVQAQAGLLSELHQQLDVSKQVGDSNLQQIAALQQEVSLLRSRTAVGGTSGRGATTTRATLA